MSNLTMEYVEEKAMSGLDCIESEIDDVLDYAIAMENDTLKYEEMCEKNRYEVCKARMDAIKNIKRAIRDNYKHISNSLSIDEKIKYETTYSSLKVLEKEEAKKIINAR